MPRVPEPAAARTLSGNEGSSVNDGPNPSGLCMCGCGAETPLADRNRPSRGVVAGQPLRFIWGHNPRKSPVEYVVDDATGCWVWARAKNENGYSQINVDGKTRRAHIIFYERRFGPVPAGLELDHTCNCRSCVNPDHLEPVTHQENCLRGVRRRAAMEEAS